MSEVMPRGVNWIRDGVTGFDPEKNEIQTEGGKTLGYDELIVAAGIQLNWDAVKGSTRSTRGVSAATTATTRSPSTWDAIQRFRAGSAIFTFPATPIKCAGAPQKIMYLAEEMFRRRGIREQARCDLRLRRPPRIFGDPKYTQALNKIVDERNIETQYSKNLVEVRARNARGGLPHVNGGEELVVKYDMLHVTPPQGSTDFIKESPLANAEGWVDVDKHTLQHTKFRKRLLAGRLQQLALLQDGRRGSQAGAGTGREHDCLSRRKNRSPRHYDGYASCPLVTGYGKVILAEFGYDGVIMETFPFDQAQERYSMYALKAYGLPNLYWHGMLQGRM